MSLKNKIQKHLWNSCRYPGPGEDKVLEESAKGVPGHRPPASQMIPLPQAAGQCIPRGPTKRAVGK